MDRIRIVNGQLHAGDRPWQPWGFNYDHDDQTPSRLIEEYWDTEPERVERDFAAMRAFGASVVRIHLQAGTFLDRERESLDRLAWLCDVAERNGLYLDVTGLAAYRPGEQPSWYLEASETQRWAAHARFWSAVAHRVSSSPAVAWFDLVNEPIVPPESVDRWTTGGKVSPEYEYCQYVTRDTTGRDPAQVASTWAARMRDVIREHDERPITIGMLPTNHPDSSGFDPHALAGVLDLVCVHEYPKADVAPSVELVRSFKVDGIPLVVEETFPLLCSPEVMTSFIDRLPEVDGWVSFYWGSQRTRYIDAWQEQFVESMNRRARP